MNVQDEIMRKNIARDGRKKWLAPLGRGWLGCAVLLNMQAGVAWAEDAVPCAVWAKAGVSYQQFRDDGLECAKQGLAWNIDESEEVKTRARPGSWKR